MARIARNPELDLCPDFAGPIFQAARDAIVASVPNKTAEDVVTDLTAAWQAEWDTKKAAWDAQETADQVARDTAAKAASDEAARKQAELDAEIAAEKKEADKKKPKLNDFDSNRGVGDAIAPRPSAYALRKLERFEYVELWYFTREGCADAATSNANHTINEDAFALAKLDDVVGLRPAASFSASKNVVKDIDLIWDQLSYAKNSMLQHMAQLSWPEKHVNALADFWFSLETHPTRSLMHGDRIALTYQAEVRIEWHESLKRNQGFNIANINDNLMRRASDKIWDSVREASMGTNYERINASKRRRSRSLSPIRPRRRDARSSTRDRIEARFFTMAQTESASRCAPIVSAGTTANHALAGPCGTAAAGAELCSDFQQLEGCSSRGHDEKHECCGCGSRNHGVQKCPRAERA
ncbi:hypothetical protein FB451DRAFT_1102566 [Mycena latifolia]|nr:hypothetical protein FB451DRAFT_1102566 [Mycena latifolia]